MQFKELNSNFFIDAYSLLVYMIYIYLRPTWANNPPSDSQDLNDCKLAQLKKL